MPLVALGSSDAGKVDSNPLSGRAASVLDRICHLKFVRAAHEFRGLHILVPHFSLSLSLSLSLALLPSLSLKYPREGVNYDHVHAILEEVHLQLYKGDRLVWYLPSSVNLCLSVLCILPLCALQVESLYHSSLVQ